MYEIIMVKQIISYFKCLIKFNKMLYGNYLNNKVQHFKSTN